MAVRTVLRKLSDEAGSIQGHLQYLEPPSVLEQLAELEECLEDLYDIEQRVLKVRVIGERLLDEQEKAEEARG